MFAFIFFESISISLTSECFMSVSQGRPVETLYPPIQSANNTISFKKTRALQYLSPYFTKRWQKFKLVLSAVDEKSGTS